MPDLDPAPPEPQYEWTLNGPTKFPLPELHYVADDAPYYADAVGDRQEWTEDMWERAGFVRKETKKSKLRRSRWETATAEARARQRIVADIEALGRFRGLAEHRPGSLPAERQRGEVAGLHLARDIVNGTLDIRNSAGYPWARLLDGLPGGTDV